ncbi:hypothetical protein G6F60_015148 [Rhizopus arrhizus]|nr:hypothetical protein G6F60_015148 [Rhizopus arrhizus]
MKASSSATMALASAPSPSGPGSTLGTAATSRSGVPATGRASAAALAARGALPWGTRSGEPWRRPRKPVDGALTWSSGEVRRSNGWRT